LVSVLCLFEKVTDCLTDDENRRALFLFVAAIDLSTTIFGFGFLALMTLALQHGGMR
jgi:hypothetical protein